MIAGEKYSIPPRGMVLKGRLQLGNMWQSDHLSRKRTPRDEGRELCEEERRHLASPRVSSRLVSSASSRAFSPYQKMSHYA